MLSITSMATVPILLGPTVEIALIEDNILGFDMMHQYEIKIFNLTEQYKSMKTKCALSTFFYANKISQNKKLQAPQSD